MEATDTPRTGHDRTEQGAGPAQLGGLEVDPAADRARYGGISRPTTLAVQLRQAGYRP